MLLTAIVLGIVLLVFATGKGPVFRVDRAGAAIIGAAAVLGLGVLTFDDAVRAVDHRTIVILFSLMVLAANLKLAGFYEWVGDLLGRRLRSRFHLLAAVVFASGVLSALCINDIVCLLLTPVVLAVCRNSRCDPLPHLLGLAMASNIGSAATLLGNPQNILIAGLSRLSFLAYFRVAAPVALVGLALCVLAIGTAYRAELRQPLAPAEAPAPARRHTYLIVKNLVVLAVVVVCFAAGLDLAVVAPLAAAYALMTRRIKPNKVYAAIDFNLLVVFAGLFVVVGAVEASGLSRWAVAQVQGLDLTRLPVFTGLTLVFSNIFSNVPAVLLLKFLVPATGAAHWWTALALFSTLAGNLTLTGSIANLIVAETAARQQVRIGFWAYFRVGFPLTLVLTGLGLAWMMVVG